MTSWYSTETLLKYWLLCLAALSHVYAVDIHTMNANQSNVSNTYCLQQGSLRDNSWLVRLFYMCWHGLPCLKWEQDEGLKRVDGHRNLTWCEEKPCLSISEHRIWLVDGIKSVHMYVDYTMIFRTTRPLQMSTRWGGGKNGQAAAIQWYERWLNKDWVDHSFY